jgi:hypothetical protein
MVNAAESLLADSSAASLASARDSIVGVCDLVK